MARWGDEKTLNFIIAYRNYECLWDVRSPLYKNKIARNKAYKDLLEYVNDKNMTVQHLKTKIKNLRSVYHTELKKVRDSQRSGAGGSIYKPNLFWFEEINSFLREITEYRNTLSTEIESQTSSENINLVCTPNQQSTIEYSTIEAENFDIKCTTPSTPGEESCTSRKRKIHRRKSHDDNNILKVLESVENITNAVNTSRQQPATALDEFHYFGQSVAAQLRQLPINIALDTQAKIQILLSETRIQSMYSNTSPTYEISDTEEFVSVLQQAWDND